MPLPSSSSEFDADFAALVAAVAAGDQNACHTLVTGYENEIVLAARLLLRRYGHGGQESMDLVQSVHRRLITGIREKQFNPSNPTELLDLVRSLLRNRAACLSQRASRRAALLAQALDRGQVRASDATFIRPLDFLLVEDLEQFIGSVDSVDRQIAALRFEGYSDQEIAEKLGLSHANVRTRLTRLRRRLTEYLGLGDDADQSSSVG